MEFIQLKNERVTAKEEYRKKIRVAFRKYKNRYYLWIGIGKEHTKNIDIKENDKIEFFYAAENNRILLIKKSNSERGNKIISTHPHSTFLTVLRSWNIFDPNENEFNIREVESDLYEGGIRIYL